MEMKFYDVLFDYASRLAFKPVYIAVKRDDKNQTKKTPLFFNISEEMKSNSNNIVK